MVVLRVLAELVREVPGCAETLGFTAAEPVVPGQRAGWRRGQHLDSLPGHRLLRAGGEIFVDPRLELRQNLPATSTSLNLGSSPDLRPAPPHLFLAKLRLLPDELVDQLDLAEDPAVPLAGPDDLLYGAPDRLIRRAHIIWRYQDLKV